MPQQQLVEIARAPGASAKILIMDEPTASLSDRETDHLFRVVRELRTQGVGIIYISHRLEELSQIADRVTVLRDGSVVATHALSEVSRADLIRLMVGRELSARSSQRSPSNLARSPWKPATSPAVQAAVRDINLSLRAGEILGVAGLVGAGRTELARTLFGLTPADSGQILLNNRPVRIDTPARAAGLGIAYVPEDRRRHGVILDLPVSSNITLTILRQIASGGFLRFGASAPSRPPSSNDSASKPPPSLHPSPRCRAATSRKSPWPAGLPPSQRFSFSTSPPKALTSARNPRFTA